MRLSVDKLPKVPKRYRVQRQVLREGEWLGFESKTEAQSEHAERCRIISRLLQARDPVAHSWSSGQIKRLIRRIEQAESLASSVYMRKRRRRVAGHLVRLMEKDGGPITAFTLLPDSWVFAAGSLGAVDPTQLLSALRQALRRKGAPQASGWFFGFIDGEYDPNSGTFRLHVHGLASGELVDVVRQLKKARNLQPVGRTRSKTAVAKPVLLQSIVRTPAKVATYVVKGFWGERPAFESCEGKLKRPRGRRRISSIQQFAEHLMWLDRWRLSDLTLLMGMSVGRRGFRVRRKCTLMMGDVAPSP